MLGFFDKGIQRLMAAGSWSAMAAKAMLLNCTVADTHVMAVTGATNASPIVLTVASTAAITTGDIVSVGAIQGNLAANGTWRATVINGTTLSLQTLRDGLASQGSGAYSGGGYLLNLTAASQLDQLSAGRVGTDAAISGKTETNGDLSLSPISWASLSGTAHLSVVYEDTGNEATSTPIAINDGRVQVVLAAAALSGATTLAIEKLVAPLANGTQMAFSNGVTATLTAAAVVGARTLTVSALSAGIAAGHQAEPYKDQPGYPIVASGVAPTDTYAGNYLIRRRPF